MQYATAYNVLLAIAKNIPVLLMTAFVLQGHICSVGGNALQVTHNALLLKVSFPNTAHYVNFIIITLSVLCEYSVCGVFRTFIIAVFLQAEGERRGGDDARDARGSSSSSGL